MYQPHNDRREERRRAEDKMRRKEEERRTAEEQSQRAQETARAAEDAKRRAEVQRMEAFRKRDEAERTKLKAEIIARNVRAEQEEAEKRWIEGNRPIITPTAEQVRETKKRLQYEEGRLHIAIAGVSGSGKSSLINALRGLRNGDQGAAPTGIIETTRQISRYPDSDPHKRIVLYDVPGAGTLATSDWVYFTDQGLYAFDRVIVLFDTAFTEADVAILRNCARFKIPTYVVRSKARQHIRNLAQDMIDDECAGENDTDLLARARERYLKETREVVRSNLERAGLPQQRVYIVDKQPLALLANGRRQEDSNTADEKDLWRDLFAKHA